MNFQKQLQVLRKSKCLSQENLAEILGVSRQAVAKWESGQSYPDIQRLIEMSEFFKISIDTLVNDDSCCSCNNNKKFKLIYKELIDFLCKAKRSTTIGQKTETEDLNKDIYKSEYKEENLKYTEKYLCGENFSGNQILWKDNMPIWSMNYFGRILDRKFSKSFLDESLSLANEENPYRGPIIHINGLHKYHCFINGEFNYFHGNEEIYFDQIKVYEGYFHGGIIKF